MSSIAIDGPAGAGKSTIAKLVAKKVNAIYVDTGAMYRAMAWYFINARVDFSNFKEIENACKKISINIVYENDAQQVILNGENVTSHLRTEDVGKMASTVAVNKNVRLKLVEIQRELANNQDVVMDGRDIGTYVLPDATVKIYLTASSRERANRRYKELVEKGINSDINVIEQDIIDRDNKDMNREFAPLKQSSDAVFIDSSSMTIDEVVDFITHIYYENTKN